MYDFEEGSVRAALSAVIADDAVIHMPFPFGDLTGPDDLYDTCYAPLLTAIPDLERRDWIVTGGRPNMVMIGWAVAAITLVPLLRRGWISHQRAT